MTTAHPDKNLYFTTILAIQKDVAVVGGHIKADASEEPSVTRFNLIRDEKQWFLFDMPDVVYAVDKIEDRSGQTYGSIYLLGRQGLLREVLSNQTPVDHQLSMKDAGYFQGLRAIGQSLFACGGQNIVMRRTTGTWERIDEKIFKPVDSGKLCGMNGIDGVSEREVYTAGQHGELYHWDGNAWATWDLNPGYPLLFVKCFSDKTTYVGGSNGALFSGSAAHGWKTLTDHALTKETFEAAAEFQGALYLAAGAHLYKLENEKLSRVDVPIARGYAFAALDSCQDALWTAGDECILRFDGHTWEEK